MIPPSTGRGRGRVAAASGGLSAVLAAPVLLAGLSAAVAHDGNVHGPEEPAWTFDPLVIAPLAISAVAYALGTARLWRRAGAGRGVSYVEAGLFGLGWAFLVAALVAPLHWLGGRLFTAHMIEHEVLMAISAPLLVLSRPVGPMLFALPMAGRHAAGRLGRQSAFAAVWAAVNRPLAATFLHGVALWVWHAPVFFEAALRHPTIHWLQHVSFFVTALLFWRALLQSRERERGFGPAIFYLFVTSLHSGFLGILLVIAGRPVYPTQTAGAAAYGLAPLDDQQLAGLVMWIPAGLVYAAAALALAGLWILRSSRPGRGHSPGPAAR